MPCPNKWVPSRLCRLGKVGGVVCKMAIFRQACTSIVENVQVFIQTTIPVQGRTQQTHFNTVGNFYMMALCNQIGSFVRLSPCYFVCTRDSRWMSYEPAAILNQNHAYIPHIIGSVLWQKNWKLLSVLCSLWEIYAWENLQCVFSLQTLQCATFWFSLKLA